jgi:hypothetical protein
MSRRPELAALFAAALLAPAGALAQRQDERAIENAAEEQEEEGDGRDVDFLWIEAGVGYSFADVVSFRQDNFFPDASETRGSGLTFNVAAGFRIYWFMFGARVSFARYPDPGFDLGTAVAEVHLRIPTPLLEPYLRVGLGFAWMGSADLPMRDYETTVHGLAVEAGAGLDFFLNKYFALGGGIDAAFLNMTRQSCSRGECTGFTEVNLAEDGDSAGIQLRVSGHASVHF